MGRQVEESTANMDTAVLEYVTQHPGCRVSEMMALSPFLRAPRLSSSTRERKATEHAERSLQRLRKAGRIAYRRESGWKLVDGGRS